MQTEEMTDPEAPESTGHGRKRVNVFVSDEAYEMMMKLGKALRPTYKRPWGDVVDLALREAYERHLGTRRK